MAEQGDIGDVTSGITAPQPLEAPPRADEIIDEETGYQVVASRLSNGGVVLLGDTHHESETHELFQRYEERLIAEGVPFALAVEFPYEVNYQIDQRSVEQILQRAAGLYAKIGSRMNEQYVRELTAILEVAKRHNISIRGIDNTRFFDPAPLPPDLAGKDRSTWMADKLREMGTNPPVLTMVGANHVQAREIPRHIDALAIRLGEDRPIAGKKLFKPGSFDYQIRTGATKARE